MNVLVTGGTGTISSGIVKESVKQGYNTFAITRGEHDFRNIDKVTYIKADVYNKDEMKKVLENLKIDIVVECLVYNLEQLKMSLENFSNKCYQYVFISTSGIYNRQNGKVSETTKKDVIQWTYTKNKIECEEYLKQYFKNRNNKFTIVRPFVTYGDYRVPYPVISRLNQWTIFERIKKGYPLVASDNVKFSVVHIDDFSYGVVKLFNNELAFNEDFHIAESNKEIYWDDIIKLSGKILNKDVNIIHIPLEILKKVFVELYDELKWNKSTELLVDDSKLKTVVKDFRQSVTLEQGLQSTIKTLENEFKTTNKNLDMSWWYKSDLALYIAYKKNKLEKNDKKIVKEYIKSIPLKTKLKMICIYIKGRLRAFKKWLKTMKGKFFERRIK